MSKIIKVGTSSLKSACGQAGDIVLTQPEVRRVTLPSTGGRIIIASDGLWDSATPKTAAHHVRGLPASKAARELGQVSPL